MLKNIFVVMAMFFILTPTTYAETRIPVSGSAFDNCTIDGGEYRESENYYACCTAPTECIFCRKGVGGECVKVSARSSLLQSLRGGMAAPITAGNFIAPVPRTPSLGDRLIRNTAPSLPAKAVSNKTKSGTKPLQNNQLLLRKQGFHAMRR